MKKCYLLIMLLSSLAFSAKASHFMGMEIGYTYTGTGNVYRAKVIVYADCQLSSVAIYTTETINFQSASLGQNFSRTIMTLPTIDTLRDMWCPSITPGCQTANPFYLAVTYTDTVTLPPASDWRLSCMDGSRTNAIVNLQNSPSLSIYVEAFLNNSAAPNSCAAMVGEPQFFVPVNTIVTQPFQVIDVDGDSVSGNMMQPLSTGPTSPAPYNAGYSLGQPLGPGSFTQLNVSGSTLKTYGSNVGRYSLAARVYDYRNGILVGYSSRDWALAQINAPNSKAPSPVAGTNFIRTTCPGQPNSYTFSFIDSVATDSVFLQFTTPNNGIAYTTSYTNGVGTASATISWTTPSTWSVSANPYSILKLSARDHTCPLSGYATYDVVVHSAQCNNDTVWAGDANADYTVNMYDPLAIAQAYGATGPIRSGASIAWTAQWCANWSGAFNGTGANYKHADCDGNGTVDNSDLPAVTANYGQVHLRGSAGPRAKEAGLPDLYFDHTGVVVNAGTTITIPIKLGSIAQPMNNIYGLAARIRISGITPGSPSISYPVSWIGTAANTLRFSKSTGTNTLDWAYARTDHQNISGQGAVTNLIFAIPAGTAGQQIILSLEDVKIINANGTEITAYNTLSDTITVVPLGVADVPAVISNAAIAPNPSPGAAMISYNLARAADVEIMITDLAGRMVWKSGPVEMHAGQCQTALPAALQSGLYLVHLKTAGSTQVLKWLRG